MTYILIFSFLAIFPFAYVGICVVSRIADKHAAKEAADVEAAQAGSWRRKFWWLAAIEEENASNSNGDGAAGPSSEGRGAGATTAATSGGSGDGAVATEEAVNKGGEDGSVPMGTARGSGMNQDHQASQQEAPRSNKGPWRKSTGNPFDFNDNDDDDAAASVSVYSQHPVRRS